MSYEAAQGEKYALLLGVKERLREVGDGEYAAYADLGHDVCFLLLLLKFWDRLPAGEGRRLVASDVLLSVVRGSEGVSLTAPLAESLRSARGLGVEEEESRESLRRALSEVLNHFDVNPR